MKKKAKYQNINDITEEDGKKSNEEFIHNIQKKHKTKVNENYKYEIKNPFIKLWSGFLRMIALIVLVPFCYIFQHLRIVNKKNYHKVKKDGCIVINNHCILLDSVMIASCLSKSKKVHQWSLQSNMDVPVAGKLIRCLGTIPIPEGNPRAMRTFMNEVERMLNEKKVVHICPEGSLWPEYKGLRTFKLGAFHFACKTNKPIVPVVYTFTLRKGAISKKEKKHYNIKMHVLKPEYPNNDLPFHEAKTELAERVFNAMADKLCEVYKDEDIKKIIWKEKYSA